MKIELLPHQRVTLVRFLYLGKTLQVQDYLDAERAVLTLILRKYAFSYISTSFTSAFSSDSNESKSPKASHTVAVLSFG